MNNSKKKFDVCVIGSGPGGFAAAVRGLDFGKHVCIVEERHIGGAGVVGGAMTSKTMWELSKDYSIAANVNRGYRASGLSVDYESVRNTIIEAAKEKQYQILSQIETFNSKKWSDGSLTLIRGRGTLKDNHTLVVKKVDGSSEEIESEFFVIATGSRPRPFPNIPFDEERILSSDGLLVLNSFPKRLIVIGAGIIGCEFATIFSNYRQTKVYLLDRQSRILPFEDEDLSALVATNLKNNNVSILHNAILNSIEKKPDHLEVSIDFEDGHTKVIEVDVALVSIGRQPNTDNMGLENAGVERQKGGYLKTDGNMCVAGNIYAVGDITGNAALVNVAEMEGRFAVKAMYGQIKYPINYKNLSTIIFVNPEVAAVGLNEQNCREKKIPHRVAYLSLALVNRAIAMRATDGFIKIIVNTDEHPKILGMRAAGPRASDLIISIAYAMDQDKNLLDVIRTIQPHPSISEAVQSCLRMLMGKSIYKPKAFPEYMHIRSWSPLDRPN